MMQTEISKHSFSDADDHLINDALSLKSQGQYSKGLKIMKQIEKQYPNNSVVHGIIASLYYEKNDFEKSEKYFRKTVELNPNSELASLGLFHSLIFLNKVNEALYELRNFVKNHPVKLYKITIDELKENISKFDEYQKKILNDIFSLSEENNTCHVKK